MAISLGACALVAWSGLSFVRSDIWRDEITLFVTSSQQGLEIPRVKQNAIAAILDLPVMRKVFRLEPASGRLIPVAVAATQDRAAIAQTLEQARAWFPTDQTMLMASAIFYAQTGDTTNAIALFQKNSGLHPKDADAWANLAQAESSGGQLDNALRDLHRALSLNPNHPDALRAESAIYWQRGDFARSLPDLERLRQLEPGDTNHLYWIAIAKEKLRSSSPAH